jgi:hypothetical protein
MPAPRAAFLAIFAFVLSSAWAQAPLNPQIEVENHAETAVKELDIKPNGTAEWGENKLGNGPLAPGKSISIREFTEANCSYEVRAVFQDGRTEEQPVDVCHHSRIVLGAKRPTADSTQRTPTTSGGEANPQVFR